MDVWWNNLLSCKDLESSNWNNQLVIQSSNFKSSNWQLKQQFINDNWLFPGWFLESSNLDTTIHTPRKINMEPQKKKKKLEKENHLNQTIIFRFYVFHLRGCFFFSSCNPAIQLHPWRLKWDLLINYLERKMIFQTSMIMFYVNLSGVYTWLFRPCFGSYAAQASASYCPSQRLQAQHHCPHGPNTPCSWTR